MISKMADLSGSSITSCNGSKYFLTEVKGSGGQGAVYAEKTGRYMIKLYYPSGSDLLDKAIIKRLKFVMNVEKPRNFVAILDIIESPYIGYVMEKVPGEFKQLNSYLIPDRDRAFSEWYNDNRGLRGRFFVGYIIAKAFGELSKQNLSYCDISGNNIFVSIGKTAAVKMIDIDNIYIAGRGASSVLGTPRYIAPEIINREKNPDVLSDNYSLAVILFELLRVGHPYISDEILEGTPEEEERAYSGYGDYVTDENSKSMLPADVVLTQRLKELFHQCFVEGKTNRMVRPSPCDFELALLDASNKVIQCPSCGAWHFAQKDPVSKKYLPCPWCDAISIPKARINFYDQLYIGEKLETSNIGKEYRTLINSYILRDNDSNVVKNMYIANLHAENDGMIPSDNYVCFPKDTKGYHVYNKFNKAGIKVRKYRNGTWHELHMNSELLLETGDMIFFDEPGTSDITLSMNGDRYHYVRMAVFMEEDQ